VRASGLLLGLGRVARLLRSLGVVDQAHAPSGPTDQVLWCLVDTSRSLRRQSIFSRALIASSPAMGAQTTDGRAAATVEMS
jgi:hypothetical protein